MRKRASFVGALAALLVLAGTREVWALGPVDVEVAVKGGYGGWDTNTSLFSSNGLGYGIGGRAGVVFHGIYGGVSVVNYAGETEQHLEGGDGPIRSFGVWTHSLLYGVELGYGFTLFRVLTIRPQVGFGNATINQSTSAFNGYTPPSFTEQALYLEPGVTALVALGPMFAGADVNGALFFPYNEGQYGSNGNPPPFNGVTFHLQAGVKF